MCRPLFSSQSAHSFAKSHTHDTSTGARHHTTPPTNKQVAMAVQIAQHADDVSTAAAPIASAPGAYKDEQLLSPVSKLEAARKQASAEQQRRVEEAVSRMASAKAENAGKRKLLEEKLDAHAKVKVQRTAVKRSVVVASNTSTTTTAATTTASTTVAHAHEQAKTNAFASVEESKTTVVAQQVRG